MPFKKGKSGNPGGRSQDDRKREDAFKSALEDVFGEPKAWAKKLKEFVDFGESHAIKLEAWKLALAYALGKPRQQVDVEVSGEIELASALEKARKRANSRGR